MQDRTPFRVSYEQGPVLAKDQMVPFMSKLYQAGKIMIGGKPIGFPVLRELLLTNGKTGET
jgi:hypothetical protein